MNLETPVLLTCVLKRGGAHEILASLKADKGVVTAVVHSARGASVMSPMGRAFLGTTVEKDILEVTVPRNRADEIFDYLCETTELQTVPGTFLFVQSLTKATAFVLPEDVPEAS